MFHVLLGSDEGAVLLRPRLSPLCLCVLNELPGNGFTIIGGHPVTFCNRSSS